MNTCTFNCSSVVRYTSFNNFSNYCTTIQQNFKIDNQDKTILLPTVDSDIVNTTSSNLATTLTSPSWRYQQYHTTSHPQFTSFPSQLPPSYSLISSLTSSPSLPKYGGKRQRININYLFTTMLTRIYIRLRPLVNVSNNQLHRNPEFVLISFAGMNPSIHLNLREIFV